MRVEMLGAVMAAVLLAADGARAAAPSEPLRVSRSTAITGGVVFRTGVTVRRDGRIEVRYDLQRMTRTARHCGRAAVTLRDARGDAVHAAEFRVCPLPGRRRGILRKRIPAALAARVHRVEIAHRRDESRVRMRTTEVATPGRAVRASRTSEISPGTVLSTEVAVQRDGRVEGRYQLRRDAWLSGRCAHAVMVLRDAAGRVIHSSEVFRGCVNPRSRRDGAFRRSIPSADAQRVSRVEIRHDLCTCGSRIQRVELPREP